MKLMLRFAMKTLLALGLCALPLGGFGTVPTLLREGSRPPAFTLPDTTGHPVHLGTLLGRKRIVLLFLPRLEDAAAQKYLQTLAREHANLDARDLVVLAVAPPKSALSHSPLVSPILMLHDNRGKVARSYRAGGHSPIFYLIGKDGGIKIARTSLPPLHELYAVIDAMPMRREEMRRRIR